MSVRSRVVFSDSQSVECDEIISTSRMCSLQIHALELPVSLFETLQELVYDLRCECLENLMRTPTQGNFWLSLDDTWQTTEDFIYFKIYWKFLVLRSKIGSSIETLILGPTRTCRFDLKQLF